MTEQQQPDRLDPQFWPVDRQVLVVDDHVLVGSTMVMALAASGLRARRCQVTSADQVLESVGSPGRHGVVLLDLDLGFEPDGAPIDELALIRTLTSRGWHVLVVSAAMDERRVADAVGSGAVGYVAKVAQLEVLLSAVCAVAAGQSILDQQQRARLLTMNRKESAAARRAQMQLCRLTTREREILELLARGERAAAIAAHAFVSLSTVRSQIRSILTKLEVNSQLEAAALLRNSR